MLRRESQANPAPCSTALHRLAAAIGEERGTIEDVLEPYLIQQGFMMRTPRGRVATRHTWQYFGLNQPASTAPPGETLNLFGPEQEH